MAFQDYARIIKALAEAAAGRMAGNAKLAEKVPPMLEKRRPPFPGKDWYERDLGLVRQGVTKGRYTLPYADINQRSYQQLLRHLMQEPGIQFALEDWHKGLAGKDLEAVKGSRQRALDFLSDYFESRERLGAQKIPLGITEHSTLQDLDKILTPAREKNRPGALNDLWEKLYGTKYGAD